MTPEALDGGIIGQIQNGDLIRLDAVEGTLTLLGDLEDIQNRTPSSPDLSANAFGMGRELFAGMRQLTNGAESGATGF